MHHRRRYVILSPTPNSMLTENVRQQTQNELESIVNRLLPDNTLDDVTKHAVLLAIYGWGLCEELGRSFASCQLCARKTGLWNYDHVEERSEKRLRRHSELVDGTQPFESGENRVFDPEMEHRYDPSLCSHFGGY